MTTTFNLTCQEIITDALELLTVIGPGMSVNGEDYVSCLRSLNMMIKSWQAPPYGFHLWKVGKGSIFLTPGQKSYQIGGSSTDRVVDDAVVTTLTLDEDSGDTALTVDDTTGMTVADVIGIVQDDGTVKWTTIATIPTSTTLTINSALTDDAASGNNVYTYTSLATRPLEISEVRLTRPDDNDVRMYPLSKDVYYNMSNKSSTGSPIQYYTEPYKTYTQMYVYGTGSSRSEYIQFNYKKILEDMTATTDLSDFPAETGAALAYNLALFVAPKFDKEDKVTVGIAGKAKELFDAMRDNDQEMVSLKIGPNLWWY